jgi:hypothetical protein
VRLSIHRRMGPVLALLAAILALTLLRPGGFDLYSTAVRFANFGAAAMLLRMYLHAPPGSLARDGVAVLKWLALQAVLTVALAVALPFAFVPVEVNETPYRTLLGLFTFHVLLEDSAGLPRPDGFFYEPGVFQIYLNVYLYLALFERRNPRHALLALLAVLATQSTTGLVIAVLQLAFFAAASLKRGSLAGRLAAATLTLAVLVPVVAVTQDNVVDKLVGEAAGSSLARQYDFLTGVNVIAAHPWLGIGFEHRRYLDAAAALGFTDTPLEERLTEDRGNTNGIVYLLYSLGIPLALPFLAGMFRQRFFEHRIVVGLLLLLSFVGESVIFTPFFLLLVFAGLLAPARPRAPAPLPAAESVR